MAAADARHAEILDNERIGANLLEPRKRLDGRRDIRLVDKRVEGDVDLPSLRMREADEVPEIVEGEVLRERARGKVWEPAVDSIRACVKRRKRGLEITGRREKFCRPHRAGPAVSGRS